MLDEIEAALDDSNLGRLLVVMEELRESSQRTVVTTRSGPWRPPPAPYGVTMRGDGVTPVVSQKLREVS